MAITRSIFKNPFNRDWIPDWICPSCKKGIIKVEDKNLKVIESPISIIEHEKEYWEPAFIYGVFVGIFKCNNNSCGEIVTISGDLKMDEEYIYDEESGYGDLQPVQSLIPKYFNPPLHLFDIHKDVPEIIKEAIKNTFSLYWLDSSSCANKIRIVVELIMDEQNISKYITVKRKRKGITLHKRIELFNLINPEQAENLMAIKWIGNPGSHSSDILTLDDLLDGYEILEHVTTKLYEKDSANIKKLVKTINKRKKPIGVKRPKPKKGKIRTTGF
jgi:hypothetical protein